LPAREALGGQDEIDVSSLSDNTAEIAGSPWAFIFAVVMTGVWLAVGPAFHFSNTWQLTMNTLASEVSATGA
jgi:low affinity Fe/Cu permease